MQSDWVYLTNVLAQETPALMATTNNKNILVWLQSDKGVEMDPHAHESQYLYPDVVKLMDSIGLPESKLMGGTIYNDNNGINIWTNLVNGQFGRIFPTKFWRPDYMMGGGTPNHVADIKYHGFWNPQSTTNYLTHDPSKRLRHIGVGCSIKIKDTSQVANIAAELRDIIQKVQTGQYPSNGFYLQTIFFEQGDLNNTAFYNKVIAVADSANAMVASGKARWKTLKQTYTQWETAYNAQMFQWECGKTVPVDENKIKVYPNPASDKIVIEIPGTNGLASNELKIYNVLGSLVHLAILSDFRNEIDIRRLQKGMYFLQLRTYDGKIMVSKIAVQ